MSGLVVRLNRLAVVRFTKSTTQVMFSKKYLLLTNTGIGLTLGSLGDVMQQKYEIACKRQKGWDALRSRRILVTNFFIGPTCHYWYLFLDAILPGRKLAIVMKKILFDQIIFSPIVIAMFLGIMGYQEGMKSKEIGQDLMVKGKDLMIAECLIWPPAQLINFFFLPTQYRVLYDNAVSLGFDYYYSYVKFRKGKDNLDLPEEDACALQTKGDSEEHKTSDCKEKR